MDEICDQNKMKLMKFIDSIWSKYDVDNSNTISVKETKQLIIDITGHEHVSNEKCHEFVKYIDGPNGDGEIDKNELISFIETGTLMSENEKKEFSQRGDLHTTLVDFFDGINKARDKFCDDGAVAATDNTSRPSKTSIHPHEQMLLLSAIESIWGKYDQDLSNTLNAKEATKMILDITGHCEIQ